MNPLRIKFVEPIPLYRLQIVWSDKRRRQHDLMEIIWESETFSILRHNLDVFRDIHIGEWGQALYWGSLSISAHVLLLPANCIDMEVLSNDRYYQIEPTSQII